MAGTVTLEPVDLYYRNARSDKEYHLWLEEVSGLTISATAKAGRKLYRVAFSYGRRGGTMQVGTKTGWIEYEQAKAIKNRFTEEKLARGYTFAGAFTGVVFSGTVNRVDSARVALQRAGSADEARKKRQEATKADLMARAMAKAEEAGEGDGFDFDSPSRRAFLEKFARQTAQQTEGFIGDNDLLDRAKGDVRSYLDDLARQEADAMVDEETTRARKADLLLKENQRLFEAARRDRAYRLNRDRPVPPAKPKPKPPAPPEVNRFAKTGRKIKLED